MFSKAWPGSGLWPGCRSLRRGGSGVGHGWAIWTGFLYHLIRRNELGIRLALGGQRSDILWLVLRQGFQMTAFGMILGVAGAIALGRLMRALLFGVTPGDPLTLTVASLLLVAVALLACWLPARRATNSIHGGAAV